MAALNLSPKNLLTYSGLISPKPAAEVVEKPPVNPDSLGEKTVLLSWKASSRPERKGISQKFIRTGIVIGLVIALVLALMQEFFLILVVASIVFFSYILINSPIDTIEHELSTHGVKTNGDMYYWYELKRFFFTTSTGTEMLSIDTIDRLPTRLFMLFNAKDKDKIREVCEKYITYVSEEPLTKWDEVYFKVMSKFNFEGR
jgi:hypothetical protein